MRDILEYCIGGVRRNVAAGTEVLHEGGRTGHLYVLIEGRLDVIRGDTVVASLSEPGAVLGEMSVLLDAPHIAKRAVGKDDRDQRDAVTDRSGKFVRRIQKSAVAVD